MAYDETVTIEGRIEHTTAKAYLVEPTFGPEQVWLPKSQIVSMSEPDEDGLRVFVISEWIANKNGLMEKR